MTVRQNVRVCSHACAYVFGFGQSRRSIVRRCIILLGAKGDDFITDPGNHSPKLILFSVKAILFPCHIPSSSILLLPFLRKERERERERERNVDVMYSKRTSRVFFSLCIRNHQKRMAELSLGTKQEEYFLLWSRYHRNHEKLFFYN